MKIRPLHTERDYEQALTETERLIARDPAPGTPAGDRLEILAVLVSDYEKKAFPIPAPDPVDAIRFRMDQMGLKPRDLVDYFGSRSRVSEVLSGKRGLTLNMIRKLSLGLGIPAEVLIQKPETGKAAKG